MTEPENRPNQGGIPLEIPAGVDAVYSNLVRISHSPADLVMDFARIIPGSGPAARVMARVLMSPVGAKLFYRALGENLARFEAAFGEIQLPGGHSSLAEDLFRPPTRPDKE